MIDILPNSTLMICLQTFSLEERTANAPEAALKEKQLQLAAFQYSAEVATYQKSIPYII